MGRRAAPLFRALVVFAAFFLVGSLGLHAVDIDHTHHGSTHAHHGDGVSLLGLSEYAHAAEKKWLLLTLILSVFLLSTARPVSSGITIAPTLVVHQPERRVRRYFDTTQWLFSAGILHPKLYA